MNITALLAAVGVCLAMVEAKKTTMYADELKPFHQPKTTKGTVLTAIEYKPLFNHEGQCSSYVAVDKDGMTSKGPKDRVHRCIIPPDYSQVYSRGDWKGGRWGQMYIWYVAAGEPIWVSIVVWLNNPDVNKQTILSVSFIAQDKNNDGYGDKYISQTPPHKDILVDGSTVKVKYDQGRLFGEKILAGQFQDVITWDLLTPAARNALNDPTNFNGIQAPFNDAKFNTNLEMAWNSTGLPVVV